MDRKIVSVLIILVFASQFVIGQNLISGTVIRENKKPFVGVKVAIEGVQDAETTTDLLGNFDIDVPSTVSVLVFSYEGMLTQRIPIGKKSFLNVTMIEGKDPIPKPVVKKAEPPKKIEPAKAKSTTPPKNESKGNKPKAAVTSDSTAKNVKTKKAEPAKAKSTPPKNESKGNKPKAAVTTDSTAKNVKAKQVKPKEEKPKKIESDNTKVKTNPKNESKGNKPKAIATPDSTAKNTKVKENKPKLEKQKEEKPKAAKATKESKSEADSIKAEKSKAAKTAKPVKEETKKEKKSK